MSVDIANAINAAFTKVQARLHNGAKGSCLIENCPNDVLAKGLCNAHYIRAKTSRDMSKPVQAFAGNKGCVDCGEPLKNKGGWLRCAKHFKVARQQAIKEALVDVMGGCCQTCGGVFPAAVFDFHHVGEKDANPSYLISNGSVERIAKELERCVLLCANCHRIEHARKF